MELKALQAKTGITFILVTHDQEDALTMSDRVAVMSGGEIRQVGTPVEIYEEPASRFVAEFIGETNLIPARVEQVEEGIAHCAFDGASPASRAGQRERDHRRFRAWKGMDKSLEQAAQDLYANEWHAFRRVTLPLLMPGILSGAMLAFIISIDDFIITLMVAQAGTTTLPLYIYGMVRTGITPEVNAVSTVMLGVSILFVTVSYFAGRRK